jgi:hypothetical protein
MARIAEHSDAEFPTRDGLLGIFHDCLTNLSILQKLT